MIFVGGINMITALLVLILERTQMIGILKALGLSNWRIRKIFLYNAAYLIGVGLLWGNLYWSWFYLDSGQGIRSFGFLTLRSITLITFQ